MKAKRQTLSRPIKVKQPVRMPLIPAMRPVRIIRSTDANPINAPPIKADMGSNGAAIGPLPIASSKDRSPEKNNTTHAKRNSGLALAVDVLPDTVSAVSPVFRIVRSWRQLRSWPLQWSSLRSCVTARRLMYLLMRAWFMACFSGSDGSAGRKAHRDRTAS
jgi:hypothetical protein